MPQVLPAEVFFKDEWLLPYYSMTSSLPKLSDLDEAKILLPTHGYSGIEYSLERTYQDVDVGTQPTSVSLHLKSSLTNKPHQYVKISAFLNKKTLFCSYSHQRVCTTLKNPQYI